MRNILLSIICMAVLTITATGQTKSSVDLNGDPIPEEAEIAHSLQEDSPVMVAENTDIRSEWMSKGPWGGNIRGFATNNADGSNVVVACGSSVAQNGGVWFSNDGGQTWNGSSINNKTMYGIYAHPVDGGTFYAGGKYGIYESTDGGETWTLIAYPSTTIIGLGMQTADPSLMVAGIASNQGVRYSSDGGANWNTTNITQGYMKDFAVSSDNPELMYLAVSGSDFSGLFTSTDGATWTAINPTASGQCYGVYVDPADADFVLLGAENGIFKSVDGGTNWTQVQATDGNARGIVNYEGTFYTCAYGGPIYESADNGDTWTIADENIVERTWAAVGVSDAGALFGNWGSVVRTDGTNYQLSLEGLNNAYVHSLAYYADRNELWAGTEGSGVWMSNDYGETWVNKSNGLEGWWTYSFAPTSHEDWQADRMMAATNNGVFYSDDYGENWQVLDQETTYYTGAMIHWTDPDIMWIAGAMGPVKYTTDGGASWSTSAGLPFAFYPRYGLCENESGDLRVLIIYEQLGSNSYYSDDMGANYSECSGLGGTSYFTDLSIRLEGDGFDQKVYMSTDQGIFKSDYGAEYTLCPGLSGLSWSVLGSEGTDVYAGANNGVFHSADEGQTWESFNTGIDYIAVWDLVYGSSTNVIYAGTRGYSVYKYGEDVITYSLPFSEDFTGQQQPADWENTDNLGGNQVWQFDNPGGRDITGAGFDSDFAILDSDNYGSGSAQDADLITPPIDCSAASAVMLNFDQSFRQYQNSVGTLSVSNNGTDWTVIYVVEENTGYPNPAVSMEFDISDVAAGESSVWVKWNYAGEWEYWWAIDNVSLTEGAGPVLDPPSNLEATVNVSEVTLTWDAPATKELEGYNVYRDNTLLTLSPVTETTYTDQNVVAGTHLYTVTAVYTDGESTPAGPVQVTIEGAVGKIHGFVRDAVTNLTLDEAIVTASNIDNGAQTYMTPFGAYYSMLLPEGTYNLTCTAEGYEDATAENLLVLEGVNKSYTFYIQPLDNESITGIHATDGQGARIYPNPATDKLYINGSNISKLEIMNQAGQLLLTAAGLSGKESINIEALNSGIYIVRITTNDAVKTDKLIIR